MAVKRLSFDSVLRLDKLSGTGYYLGYSLLRLPAWLQIIAGDSVQNCVCSSTDWLVTGREEVSEFGIY
ncbi:MAG: hypothetical protein JXM69_20470 [Anaerolineae bacterium]|nr:hypothetical protein [Anaerolineae bacterium]